MAASFRRVGWAGMVALCIALAASQIGLPANCDYQPDAPGCPCFNGTGAWNPDGDYVQDAAIPTVGTIVSCKCDPAAGCTDPPLENSGKPYYQMVLGCATEWCASDQAYALSTGVVLDPREWWCSESVSFWHLHAATPYPGGYRNDWYLSWKIGGVGGLEDWYSTEEWTAGGRGHWIGGEEVRYGPFELGVTVPVPGSYVAIRAFDRGWLIGDAAATHSLMINEMWVHRDFAGRVFRVEVSLLEGNSGEQVKDTRVWTDILSITPGGSAWIGSTKKIYGFGVDLNADGSPRYNPSRLHYVDHTLIAFAVPFVPTTPDDPDREGHGQFLVRLRDYAAAARLAGGPTVTSTAANLPVTRVPDGESGEWRFPAGIAGPFYVLIDLLDVHPLPIRGIVMTWDPGFVPRTGSVEYSADGLNYHGASLPPPLPNSDVPLQEPVRVPAVFSETEAGVPVRYVRLNFPAGAFPAQAVLRGIDFRYEEGPWHDAPANGIEASMCNMGLSARARTGQVQLAYAPVPGANHYNVYRGTADGGPYVLVGQAPGTQAFYNDRTVTNGRTYYYVVRFALADNSEVCQSNQASARPLAR